MRFCFDISKAEVRSFDGGFYRPAKIDGPNQLVRFSDTTRGAAGKYGRFWMYGDEVAEILRAGPSSIGLLSEVSNRWAVCDDWGDLGLVWVLTIPPGFSLAAWFGKAKAQPQVHDPAKPSRKNLGPRPYYDGGSLQLIVPVIDENGDVDKQLASWISGPTSLGRVAADPGALLHP